MQCELMISLVLVLLFLLDHVHGHARLLEPPSRASAWRVGFPTPKDQDDNQNYCGGFGVMYNKNHGK